MDVIHRLLDALLPSTPVALGALGFILAVIWTHRDRALGASKCDLEGPKGWPVIGNLPMLLRNSPRMLEHDLMLRKKHGPIYTSSIPGLRMIALQRPDLIEYVQSNQGNFSNYPKGTMQSSRMEDVLGQGIFASDGHAWLSQRKAASHIFSRSSFTTVIQAAVVGHVRILTDVIGKHAAAGETFALNDLFMRFTLDAFVDMSFGVELASMEAGKPVPFATAFDYAQEHINRRFQSPIWKFAERFSGGGRKMRQAIAEIDKFAYGIIDKRQKSLDAGQVNEQGADLLALFANVRDEKGGRMSRKELRDAILNLIIAGRDTTAQALAWTFWYLVNDPKLVESMREEIKRVLGENETTYDNHRDLILVNAVFHEALRLHPSVAKNGKYVIADDQIPNGPFVRAGDSVRWTDWAIARDPEVWGPDAGEFKPSRWIDDDGKLRHFSQWQYHVFNGGPRLCLGQNMAIYEGLAAIVGIVRDYDLAFAPGYRERVPKTEGILSPPEPQPTPLYLPSLTLPMRDAMMVTAKRRAA